MDSSSGASSQEFTGKSVEEATAEGLRTLGLREEDATIEILSRGSRGLFGLGSEPAIVRISRRTAPVSSHAPAPASTTDATPDAMPESAAQPTAPAPTPIVATPSSAAQQEVDTSSAAEPVVVEEVIAEEAAEGAKAVVTATEVADDAEVAADAEADVQEDAPALRDAEDSDEAIATMASEMLSNIVRYMKYEGRVDAEWRDADAITDERHLLLSIRGREVSGLIGRRGDTLENMQYLLRLMVNQRMHRWLNIIVDVEDFRAKRVEHLTHLAHRMADQVVSTSRSFALEPMTPNERRIVHLALRDDERIFTESTGEGERRKVVIFPAH